MNAATEIRATVERAITNSNAIGVYHGFEEGRFAVLRFLLDEIDAGRHEQSLLALYVKVQALPNPNKSPRLIGGRF